MSWHAVEALDRAVDATRRFLFPFEAVRWVKIAFLALVMAGGTAGGSRIGWSNLGVSAISARTAADPVPMRVERVGSLRVERVGSLGIERVGSLGIERVAGLDDALLVAVGVGALSVGIGLAVCSVAFRLVFYDALATTEVALRRPFRDRFRQALGLFAFVTALAVAAGIPAIAFVLALDPDVVGVLGVSTGGFSGPPAWATAVLGVSSVAIGLIAGLGGRLTFELVAPAMVARDVGVLAGWRRVWASVRGTPIRGTSTRGSWIDVVAYLAVHAVVAAGVGFVQVVAVALAGGTVAAVALVALVLAAVPLGGLGALTGTTVGSAVLATVLVCVVAATVVLALPVRLVARTYLTAYEVSTLAGIDPESAPLASTLVENKGDGFR